METTETIMKQVEQEETEGKRFAGTEETAFGVNVSKIFKSKERSEADEKRYFESKDISEKQVSFLRYLSYKKRCFKKMDWDKIRLLNMYEGKKLIEELQ